MKKKECPVYFGDCQNCICFIDSECKYNHKDYQGFCYQCQRLLKTGIEFCSVECETRFKEESKKEQLEIEKENKKNQDIIEYAKKHLTKKQIEYLEDEFNDIYPFNCEIVNKPHGTFQDCNMDDSYKEWVDQRSVGYSGDSFEGEVYIELLNKKYLKYSYEC